MMYFAWVMGVIVYLALGLSMVAALDDNPDCRSIVPLLLWPVIIIAAPIMMLIKRVGRLK